MQKWDFKFLAESGDADGAMKLYKAMKEAGDLGWELVSVTYKPYREDSDSYADAEMFAFLKRPKD